MAAQAPAKVGFLGLGVMGKAMAGCLAESGLQVMAWNRTAAVAQELAAAHPGRVTAAAEAAEVTAACAVTFAMLSGPAAARAVAAAAAPGLRAGGSYIDCSTVDEGCSADCAALVEPRGAAFLASPVSGGWREAAKGKLLFICGGAQAAYDAGRPAIDAMAARSWLVGDTVAHAARAKLSLQVSMGTLVASLAEMLAFGDAAGVDKEMLTEMLALSALGSPMTKAKGKLIVGKTYGEQKNFQTYLQQKDLRLAMELGNELDIQMPITAAANAMYVRAKQLGHAHSDFSAVAEAYCPPKKPE